MCIEITEHVVMPNVEPAVQAHQGALIDTLKVDQTFVDAIPSPSGRDLQTPLPRDMMLRLSAIDGGGRASDDLCQASTPVLVPPRNYRLIGTTCGGSSRAP